MRDEANLRRRRVRLDDIAALAQDAMNSPVELPVELLEAVKRALPRSSRRQHAALAQDLAGVWWGLRTAVLVDSCMLSEQEASSLGRHLQVYSNRLFALHEPVSGQTLVVNRTLLEERLCEPVSFVEVGGKQPDLLAAPPPAFTALLANLSSSPESGFIPLSLPDPSAPQDLIPLVGFLLDYPVAYSLTASEDGRNCLGGVELCVVEAMLVGAGGTRQRLLSFSYPASLAHSGSPLHVNEVLQALQLKLDTRLAATQRRYPELEGATIAVDLRAVVLDQVAL